VNRALAAGAAGMAAQQAVLDAVAANLSNLDTPGFRADRPEFAALVMPDGAALASAAERTQKLFIQGRLDTTNNEHDLAIDGEGLFEVEAFGGRSAFTRAGNFTPDAAGHLRLANGAVLAHVKLPPGTVSMSVDASGRVRAKVAGKQDAVDAGQIQLCAFAQNPGLRFGLDSLFYATPGAGALYRGVPGTGGFGLIKQRFLERSNVSVVGAMMSVLAAQRAYEANAKSVQAADEMLRLANNLERG
jgi:flagellar basal-body rod protein FlgG